jgi:hypothetical protein
LRSSGGHVDRDSGQEFVVLLAMLLSFHLEVKLAFWVASVTLAETSAQFAETILTVTKLAHGRPWAHFGYGIVKCVSAFCITDIADTAADPHLFWFLH